MKTILAIWHNGNRGKTKTLREFSRLLLETYKNFEPIYFPDAIIPENEDFRLVIRINGIIIGVESKGDPNTNLEERLADLVDNFKCDVLLCTTRISGSTVLAVNSIANTRKFQIIWTSTYQIAENQFHDRLNAIKGKHILELLQSLELI